jgi:hypothetical protein
MKVRLTPTYIGTAFVVVIIFIFAFYRIGTWLGWWGFVDVYDQVETFIINWVIVITFAILGGILFGMFVGFRLLSSQGFTPFEKSMLEMYAKVDDIHDRMSRIEDKLGIKDTDTELSSENASLRESLRIPGEDVNGTPDQ